MMFISAQSPALIVSHYLGTGMEMSEHCNNSTEASDNYPHLSPCNIIIQPLAGTESLGQSLANVCLANEGRISYDIITITILYMHLANVSLEYYIGSVFMHKTILIPSIQTILVYYAQGSDAFLSVCVSMHTGGKLTQCQQGKQDRYVWDDQMTPFLIIFFIVPMPHM
jgi:hypothetical protein